MLDDVGDTVIYPLLEMGQLDIHQDSRITQKLLETFPEDSQVSIATGYFNMTEEYAVSIIEKSKACFRLLMAHPTVILHIFSLCRIVSLRGE